MPGCPSYQTRRSPIRCDACGLPYGASGALAANYPDAPARRRHGRNSPHCGHVSTGPSRRKRRANRCRKRPATNGRHQTRAWEHFQRKSDDGDPRAVGDVVVLHRPRVSCTSPGPAVTSVDCRSMTLTPSHTATDRQPVVTMYAIRPALLDAFATGAAIAPGKRREALLPIASLRSERGTQERRPVVDRPQDESFDIFASSLCCSASISTTTALISSSWSALIA